MHVFTISISCVLHSVGSKYMYTNTTCCSSQSLTYTARRKRLLWSFYMPQYVKYLPNLWVKVMHGKRPRRWMGPQEKASASGALRAPASAFSFVSPPSPRLLSITYTRKYVIYYFTGRANVISKIFMWITYFGYSFRISTEKGHAQLMQATEGSPDDTLSWEVPDAIW